MALQDERHDVDVFPLRELSGMPMRHRYAKVSVDILRALPLDARVLTGERRTKLTLKFAAVTFRAVLNIAKPTGMGLLHGIREVCSCRCDAEREDRSGQECGELQMPHGVGLVAGNAKTYSRPPSGMSRNSGTMCFPP